MAHTTLSPLQPLSMGQILDRGIRLYRQHFLTFVGIVALAQIPATLITIMASIISPVPEFISPGASPSELFSSTIMQSLGVSSGLLALGVIVLSIILSVLSMAALTRAAADSYLTRPSGIVPAYQAISRFTATLLGTYCLGILLTIGLTIWLLIPLVGWFTGPGMLLFLAIVVFPFMIPVIVVERQPAVQAVQRAWNLARQRFWWLIGFMLLLGLFGQVVVTVPALLAGSLIQVTLAGNLDALSLRIVQQIVGLLLSLIYQPLQLTCVMLLYFDVRVRTEGLDLALQTTALTNTSVDEVALGHVLQTPPPAPQSIWPSWNEMAYFLGLSAGAVLLLCGFYMVIILIGLAFLGTL